MAVIQNNLTGDGSTVLFSFTFQYLEESHVKVEVDGVALATTQYSFANATTLQFTTAPANGAAVRIFRDTDDSDVQAAFFAGSAIRASDLNDNFRQTLFVTQEVRDRFMDRYGTTMEGDLNMNPSADIVFEGSTADANETTLSAVDPTADRTILLPDVSGNVVTTGDTGTVSTGMVADSAITSAKIANGTIVDADISGSAEIDVSKLQDGSARQLLQTDAAGTGVQWTNDVDVPGTLDVTGATTLDSGLSVTGNIGVSGTVDGRDVAADGTKLDGIESGATADQTAAEIRSLVESASNSNVFTDADHSKLNAIEAGATADQNAAEIRSLVDSASNSNVYIDSHHAILDGATVNTSELNVLDGITANTTELNQLDGRTITTSFNANNANDIPTSSAINSYVVGLMDSLGGFVAIPNENSFPTSNPDPSDNAGTVVSIANAGGLVINGSGVATGQTTGAVTVTINGFPSSLHSTTLADGLGLQVQTTTTDHTYTYHKLIAKETDITALSDDINDFNNRYRVSATAPTSSLDDGDLWFDTTAGKMKVYDATDSAWEEVQSVGNFFINTISSSSGTGGGSATFNGSAYRFTLSNAPAVAQQLLVSINGVIQKPNSGTSQPSEGFAIDTNDIIFAAAPATGSSFFIVTVGSTVNIGTPSNNTVNAAHIIDGSITNAEISGSAAIAGTKISPNFGSQNVLTTGSVGIGDSSPGHKLVVKDAGASNTSNYLNVISGNAANAGIAFGDTDTDLQAGILYLHSDNALRFFKSGFTEAARIDSSGNVLVGTTTAAGNMTVNMGTDKNISFNGNQGEVGNVPSFVATNNAGSSLASMGFRATDLRFATGSAERMRIDSSGNVGIGDTSPSNKLVVKDGGSPTIEINGQGRAASLTLGVTASESKLFEGSNNALAFGTNNTERLRIDSDGRLLIGTSTSPSGGDGHAQNARLLVRGRVGVDTDSGRLNLQRGSAAVNGSSIGSISFTDSSNGIYARIESFADSTTGTDDYPGRITFSTTSNGANSTTERMRIDSSGNVGIGISSPESILHIVKNSTNNTPLSHNYPATQSGLFVSNNQTGTTGAFSAVTLRAYNSSGAGQAASIIAQSTGSGHSPSVLLTQRSGSGTNAERIRINSAGKIGVGTSSNINGLLTLHQDDDQLFLKQTDGDSGFLLGSNNTNGNLNLKRRSVGSNTTIATFRAAGGISFNGDTATANALADYEEGSWTPTAANFDGTLTIESADYVKVGRLVHINMYISFSNTTDTSTVRIDGLPFTVSGQTNHYSLISAHSNGNIPDLALRPQGTTTSLTAVYLNNGDGDAKPNYNHVRGQFIIAGGTYYTT